MTKGITVKRQFLIRRGRRNKRQVLPGAQSKDSVGRVPRISRLMALAVRFDQLICNGIVADQAELAQLGRVSRARLTQIMNLNGLAPDIQETILHLSSAGPRPRALTERHLRPIAAKLCWHKQREAWTSTLAAVRS